MILDRLAQPAPSHPNGGGWCGCATRLRRRHQPRGTGVGGTLCASAVPAAPGRLDRMSSSDSGLVGVRKSAPVVVSVFGRSTSGSDSWREGYRKGKSGRSCRPAGICAMSSSSPRRSRVRPNTWRMFGRAGAARSCRCGPGGDKDDRTYKDLDRLLVLLRGDFGYRGFIGLYLDGDPDLARYRALSDNEAAGEQT